MKCSRPVKLPTAMTERPSLMYECKSPPAVPMKGSTYRPMRGGEFSCVHIIVI